MSYSLRTQNGKGEEGFFACDEHGKVGDMLTNRVAGEPRSMTPAGRLYLRLVLKEGHRPVGLVRHGDAAHKRSWRPGGVLARQLHEENLRDLVQCLVKW